jgi:hypothetical protein
MIRSDDAEAAGQAFQKRRPALEAVRTVKEEQGVTLALDTNKGLK